MIANIRIIENGNSKDLCQLDIMRFSKEAIIERMNERGISDDAFFVCGFVDWDVDTIMSLEDAYLLRRVIEELYDNDPYVVIYLLQKRKKIAEIISNHYIYSTKDDLELMIKMMENKEMSSVVTFFRQTWSWDIAVSAYIDKGIVLNTPKGFYVNVDYI